MRRGVILLAFAGCIVASPAYANDPAAAQALFDQAQALMRDGRWSDACPKLEESQRLDPGDGTVLHLAACREHEGKIATAWALYQDALVAAKRSNNKSRARVAQERVDFLGPRLPRLRLKVAFADKKLPAFKVMRDDTAVGPALWGDAFPIDPGAHTITATADGYKKWSRAIDISASPDDTTVDVPLLDAEPNEKAGGTPSGSKRPETPREDDRGDTQRTVGIALGAIGAAGLAAGGIFGVLALSKNSDADEHCAPPDYTRCSAAGVDAGKQSETFGTVSTIAFVAGGAFALGGLALYFTAPSHTRMGIAPAIAPGSIGLVGRF